ncbi:MAG TPA: BMP family ABC transporter substrate-binding protein [Dongiaceae bacterium]|nr:BMP family ABC transporter substrate-binding protein [Dongiaceae bacterium]
MGGALAHAADVKPCMVYDAGGKFDKSFNEAAYNGITRFKKEAGIKSVLEFEVKQEADREEATRKFAQKGCTIIFGVGFANEDTFKKVAPEFPNVKFAIIDDVVEGPNISSLVFKEQEGSFLVGVAAALASKSGKVGFVGGMDIPLIRKFACGYEQGVKYAKKDASVIQNMTGTTPAAWNDPARGGELAKGQFDQGADVVYAAAGGTGIGVYQAAKDAGKLAIGVDSNQNYLQPGTMLTSMVKKVDVAVYDTAEAVKNGTWKPGIQVFGLGEKGVDWALDKYNQKLITPEIKAEVTKAKADIIAGKIKVHDYTSDNSCTY